MSTTGSSRVWLITGASSGFGREFVRATPAAEPRLFWPRFPRRIPHCAYLWVRRRSSGSKRI